MYRPGSWALAADSPPRYVRAPTGPQLDPMMGVIEQVLRDWPEIKAPRLTELLRTEHGYEGSVDLVRRKLQTLRPQSRRILRPSGCVLCLAWPLAGKPGRTSDRYTGRSRRPCSSDDRPWIHAALSTSGRVGSGPTSDEFVRVRSKFVFVDPPSVAARDICTLDSKRKAARTVWTKPRRRLPRWSHESESRASRLCKGVRINATRCHINEA